MEEKGKYRVQKQDQGSRREWKGQGGERYEVKLERQAGARS